ncbi:MAG TPA: hypothetical protein PLZ51_01625, partial [Aggregatilineales bacterium]|nr:hypothetical protein [Aggregatilineales bacterium]
IIYQQPVTVREGTNSYTVRLLSGTSGFRDFKVRIDSTDGFYQNNTLSAFTRVEGIPRVLVVVGENGEEDTRYIIPALQENGLE